MTSMNLKKRSCSIKINSYDIKHKNMKPIYTLIILISTTCASVAAQEKLPGVYFEAGPIFFEEAKEPTLEASISLLPIGGDAGGAKAGISLGYFKMPDIKGGLPICFRAVVSPNKVIGNASVGYIYLPDSRMDGGLYFKVGAGYAFNKGKSAYFIANFTGAQFKVGGVDAGITKGGSVGFGVRI